MNIFIVVEGNSDIAILRAVLPPAILNISDMIAAGGRSLSSVGRTLLVKHRRPLALLLDTDSLDPSVILDTVRTTEHLLRTVAAGTPFKVIYCVPELEAIFFESGLDLKRIFPQYDEHFFLMYAKTRPKEALTFLFQHGGGPTKLAELLDALTSEDVEKLRSAYPIQHLIEFVSEVCKPVGT